jgi:hypothetical protein
MAGHRRIAWESITGKPFVRAAVTTKILFFGAIIAKHWTPITKFPKSGLVEKWQDRIFFSLKNFVLPQKDEGRWGAAKQRYGDLWRM